MMMILKPETRLQDVVVALIASPERVRPASQAVVDEQAVAEDIHRLALAGAAPAAL